MHAVCNKIKSSPFNYWNHSTSKEAAKSLYEWISKPDNFGDETWQTSLKGRIKSLPGTLFAFARNGPLTRIALQVVGIASKIFSLEGAKGAGAVPYVGLVTSPIYLTNALIETYDRLKFMIQALKTGQYGEAAFMGGGALGAIDNAIGAVGTSLAGSAELAGISEVFAPAEVLFELVIPIISIVTGAIGVAVEGCGLHRNIQALNSFGAKLKEADEDVEKLQELLHYLRGEEELEEDATEKQRVTYKVKQEFFVNTHFTSEKRYLELKKRIETLLQDFDEAQCQQIIQTARGEMHRRMLYHVVALTTALLGLTAGILYLSAPQYQMVAIYLWAASAALDIALILFDKTVSMDRFAKMDRWLGEVFSSIDLPISEYNQLVREGDLSQAW